MCIIIHVMIIISTQNKIKTFCTSEKKKSRDKKTMKAQFVDVARISECEIECATYDHVYGLMLQS